MARLSGVCDLHLKDNEYPMTAMQQEQEDRRPKRRRRLGWVFLNFCFVGCLALVAVAGASLFYLLTRGENLDFLRARIEKTLNERAGGAFTVRLASADISVRDGSGAALYLGGLEVEGEGEGRRFFLLGERIAVTPNWFSLLSGPMEIRSVSVDGAKVVLEAGDKAPLRKDKNFFDGEIPISRIAKQRLGSFESLNALPVRDLSLFDDVLGRAGFDIEGSDGSGEPEILQLAGSGLERAGEWLDKLYLLGLGRVEFRNVDVELVDKARNPVRAIAITSFGLRADNNRQEGARQRIEIATRQRGEEGVGFTFTHIKNKSGTKRAFLFEMSNFIARNFIERLNDPDYPVDVSVPFSLQGQAVVGNDGMIEKFTMSAYAGSGSVTTGPKSTFQVTSGALNLSLNRRDRSLTIEPSPFVFGKNRMTAEGEIKFPVRLFGPYFFELAAMDSYFDSPDANSPPVVVERTIARGALQPKQRLISVSDFELKAGDVNFAGAASFGFDGPTPSMALAAEASPMPVAVLKQLWPIFIAPSARGWALENVHEGVIAESRVDSSIPVGVLGRLRKGAYLAPGDLELDFSIIGASFDTFGNFPRIDNALVHGKVSGVSFTADLSDGRAHSAYGRIVEMKKGRFHVADSRFPGPIAEIDFELGGSAQDIGEIAERKPVNALTYAGIGPEGLEGKVLANVAISLPLQNDIKAEDVQWRADLDLENFTSPAPIDNRKIEKANARIMLLPHLIKVNGKGLIDGVAADLNLIRPLDGKGETGSFDVKAELGDEDRKKLGIGLEEYLKGPVAVAIKQTDAQQARGDLYEMDLSRAEIRLDFLGWHKAQGIPATALMRLSTDEKGTKVRDFILTGDGFHAEGDVDLTTGGEVESLVLRKFALRASDDVRVEAKLRAEKIYEIKIEGSSFDARSLIRQLTETPNGDEEGESYRYKIAASLATVTGYLGEVIDNFALNVSLRGSVPLLLMVEGYTKGAKKPFSITYGSQDNRGDVLAAGGSNGGALARFGNIYYRAFGGDFRLDGVRPPGAKAMTGNFKMVNFHLVEEPALRGLSVSRDNAGRLSTKFDILDVDFVEEEQRLTTTKGLLSGDNIGGTYEGVLNRRTKEIDFTGTYVPAYVLNNFFTKIPILGPALGNGQREGVIGVTFKVEGTLGAPQVTVNPLSALAPGFLRQLFKFRKTQGQGTPSQGAGETGILQNTGGNRTN